GTQKEKRVVDRERRLVVDGRCRRLCFGRIGTISRLATEIGLRCLPLGTGCCRLLGGRERPSRSQNQHGKKRSERNQPPSHCEAFRQGAGRGRTRGTE